eukprot:CAMPEP_0182425146 /NCGR_PEP_ID=MMETSP1167-20130531/11501_1 /TAXON_ID=2988 /ORGANISM="Mallomonas Sp, Strain CCMP3275" /LENGTH=288 /DNA_ID=CAMNT_0024605567 /DNA_START=67 /DNA_END=933 /DNA_ORIENTATION=+
MSHEESPMVSSIPSLQLNDGNDMPQLGLVGFRNDSADDTRSIVFDKLDEGIRHYEVTELFGNGFLVVDCVLAARALPREQCYFTLKIWPKYRKPSDLVRACKDTLSCIGLSYIDLLLMHSPIDMKNRVEQWKAFEQLKNDGLAKSVGVSNAPINYLSKLFKSSLTLPAVVEIEITPFGQRLDLIDVCNDNGILILNSDPIAKGIKSKHPELMSIAASLNLSTDEIMIRWAITKGYGVLLPPGNRYLSVNYDHAFEPLSPETMRRLRALEEGLKAGWETTEVDSLEDTF